MKAIKKFIAALVALVMGIGVFAFTACDEATNGTSNSDGGSAGTSSSGSPADDSTGSSDSTPDDDDSYSNGTIDTVTDILTSETGYEITAYVIATTTSEYSTYVSEMTVTVKTKSDGESLNADIDIDSESTYTYQDEEDPYSYTSCNYTKVYLRGTAVYYNFIYSETEITDSEKAALPLYYIDLNDADLGVDFSEYLSGDSSSLDDVTNVAALLVTVLLTDYSDISIDLTGVTLTYDIANVLITHIDKIDSVLDVIITGTESGEDYTLGEFLADDTVKTTIESYLGDFTGKDIYDIIDSVASVMDYTAADLVEAGYITEGTEDQSAYDYIVDIIDSVEISGEKLSDLSLNDETLLSYVSTISETLATVKTNLEEATITFELTYSISSYSLTGLSLDIADLTIDGDGSTLGLFLDVEISAEDVTLYDTTDIAYIVSEYQGAVYGSSDDELTDYQYDLYCYFLSDGTIQATYYTQTVSLVDDEYISSSQSTDLTGTYTTDENGNIEDITIGEATGSADGEYLYIEIDGHSFTLYNY